MQLTPNRRLALFLHRQQKSDPSQPKGKLPSIFPFQGWVDELWQQLNTLPNLKLPTLLSPYEEELLWEKLITQSDLGKNLLGLKSLVVLAIDARELCCGFLVPNKMSDYQTEECQAFFEWHKVYKQELQDKQWIDRAGLLNFLSQHLGEMAHLLPKHIECIGFSEWTPAQNQFLERLKEQDVTLTLKEQKITPNSLFRSSAVSSKEELQKAAHMLKQWLNQQPNAKIGLVILDLEQRREEVESLLQEIFPPQVFNIAAPVSLLKHPIMASALQVLSLTTSKIPLEGISRFLRSPFFKGGIEEQEWRAVFDASLHQLKNSFYSLEEILSVLISLPECLESKALVTTLENLVSLKSKLKGQKTTQEWVTFINEWLTIAGWGEGRTLSTEETSVKAEFDPLLLTYQSLDKMLGQHSFNEALYHLESLAQKTCFLPPANNPSIHVLGLLEAVGIPFDYLWVLGMSQEVWPLSPAPNPLIPLSLQCALNLPRSNSERELTMARHFTRSLCFGARNTVVFSHALKVEDRPMKISSLLKHLPEHTILDLTLDQSLEQTLEETSTAIRESNVALQTIQSQAEQRIKSLFEVSKVPSKQPLKGSLRAITLQGQCPFRAFAELRLKAVPLEKPPRSLTKGERGEIVHEVLHLFWSKMRTHEKLLACSDSSLQEFLITDIETVVSRWEQRFPKRLTKRYMMLERQRLLGLLMRFMELEKSRAPFSVSHMEEKTIHPLGPLVLNMRIDRIDILENGDILIIDYKTGLTQPSSWFGETIKEPQLPLYCLSQNLKPSGIAFAVLRSNDLKYQGIAKEELSIPGIKPISKMSKTMLPEAFDNKNELASWDVLQQFWKTTLEKVAIDYAEGVVAVQPLQGETTCRQCTLQGLCGIEKQNNTIWNDTN